MEKNVRVDEEGKITAIEFAGEVVPLTKPVSASKLGDVQEHVKWVEENLSLSGVEAGTETKEWDEETLREFLEARIRKNKHNQLCFLAFLAQKSGVVKKEEINGMMEEFAETEKGEGWVKHSFGGMKGGLANKINGKGNEKLWDDRQNSELEYGEYRIKSDYQDIIKEVLSEYPKKPEGS